jgi:AcrR family transcriptional regulator
MPRPDRSRERRRELLPALARAFADFGYRRATTAALAERCGVQEKSLFRLWPDKRAMFLAALDRVFEESEAMWSKLAAAKDGERTSAERLLAYESRHHGENRLYRIVFAGLSETDDPEIRSALADLFGRFHALVADRVREHRGGRRAAAAAAPELAAWAIVGLGVAANVGRELGTLSERERERLFTDVGGRLLD